MVRATVPFVTLVFASGCALVWGFEDRELQQEAVTGGNGPVTSSSSSATTGGSGGMASGGTGGAGGSGGEATGTDVLLIADAGKNAVGLYDPFDGHYLGVDLIPEFQGTEPYDLSAVYQASQGPDGRIYVLDRIEGDILAFHPDGGFDGVFVDDLQGITALAFRDGDVFVAVKASTDSVVARFDVSGQRLEDFLVDDPPFDEIRPEHIHFLDNKTMLMSHTLEPEEVRLYDVVGPPFLTVFTPDYAVQVVGNAAGGILSAEDDAYRSHDTSGNEQASVPATLAGGIWELGNGHWIATELDGVQEVDPVAMEVVQTIRIGNGYWKIGQATLPEIPD